MLEVRAKIHYVPGKIPKCELTALSANYMAQVRAESSAHVPKALSTS